MENEDQSIRKEKIAKKNVLKVICRAFNMSIASNRNNRLQLYCILQFNSVFEIFTQLNLYRFHILCSRMYETYIYFILLTNTGQLKYFCLFNNLPNLTHPGRASSYSNNNIIIVI